MRVFNIWQKNMFYFTFPRYKIPWTFFHNRLFLLCRLFVPTECVINAKIISAAN